MESWLYFSNAASFSPTMALIVANFSVERRGAPPPPRAAGRARPRRSTNDFLPRGAQHLGLDAVVIGLARGGVRPLQRGQRGQVDRLLEELHRLLAQRREQGAVG